MVAPRATDDGLSMSQVVALTGVRASTLRVWEKSTGWPCPGRSSNGYRLYPPHLVEQIKRVAALHKAGHLISDIIVDGLPVLPASGPLIVAPSWSCLVQLPICRSSEGELFRLRMERAVRRRDVAAILLAVHAAVIALRPGDRLICAWLPAYFGAREWARSGRPLAKDVPAAIARVAGRTVLDDLAERWQTADAIG